VGSFGQIPHPPTLSPPHAPPKDFFQSRSSDRAKSP
jgi:hypothetical protein